MKLEGIQNTMPMFGSASGGRDYVIFKDVGDKVPETIRVNDAVVAVVNENTQGGNPIYMARGMNFGVLEGDAMSIPTIDGTVTFKDGSELHASIPVQRVC